MYNPLFAGATATTTSTGDSTSYTNGTVSTMPTATAVSINGSGDLILTDVTNTTIVDAWVGLTAASIAASASGQVMSSGRLLNIPLGLGFTVGQPIWVGTAPGSLTNVAPDITAPGWAAGDWVLLVGIVVQNQLNPGNQDIQLLRQIVGQLG